MADLAVLFHRLGPYHRARLDALGRRAKTVAVELSGETHDYDWDKVEASRTFERATLFPECDSRSVPLGALRERLHSVLERARPDVLALPGWADRGALVALAWGLRTGTPAVVMSASTARDAERTWWREAIKRRVVRRFGAGLGGGVPHTAYLEALGLPEARVFPGYDVVDNAHFSEGAQAARADADAVRARLELPARYVLAVSRFLPKKNLRRLLRAYAQYRGERGAAARKLVLLGDGPRMDDVRRRRRALGLEDDVWLPGFEQYDALPAYYGLADAFVLSSIVEQWGLVVNEAMASGLPVLVSERCGCVEDLVEDGRNGFTFDPYDPDALAECLLRLTSDACDRAAMGAASREIVGRWTPDTFAQNLLRAAEAARQAPRCGLRGASGLLDRLLLNLLTRR